MKILNYILEIIKKIFLFLFDIKNINTVIFFGSIILVLLLLNECNKNKNLKTEIAISNQNIIALSDTVKSVKNKNGELQQEKYSLISHNGDLKKLNDSLYIEQKKQKDRVIFLNSLVATLKSKNDSLLQENNTLKDKLGQIIIGNDTINYLSWDFSSIYDSKNSRTIKGKTKFMIGDNKSVISKGSMLEEFNFKFNLVTGLSETDDKKLKIWAKSDYPGLEIVEMDGALIDPKNSDVLKNLMKPKKWSVGVQVGYGVMLNSNQVKSGIYVGAGLQYNLFHF